MRRCKNGLAEERLSFIEKKQLMKIRARKPFLITFCNLHIRGLSSRTIRSELQLAMADYHSVFL